MSKINSFGCCCSVIAITGAPFWGIVSSKLIDTSKNDVLLSMLIGYLIAFIISKIIISIFDTNHDTNINDKIKKIYGKYNKIISGFYILLTYSLYIFTIYRLTSFLANEYLIETPKVLILILIAGTSIYISYKGIETLSRVATISFYLGIGIYLFDIVSLVRYIDIDNYLPLFTTSFKNIAASSLLFGMFFSVPLIYINTLKKNQLVDKDKFNKMFYIMSFISFIMLFSAMGTTLGIYGSKLCSLFDYPLYSVLKRISLFSFIDSLENFSIMLWILYVINGGSFAIYTAKKSIIETFKIDNKTISIVLFILTILIPTVFLINNNYTESFEYLIVPIIINIGLLLFAVCTLFLSKKKM